VAGPGFAERRGRGEDAIYFGHEGNGCTDPARHRYCNDRWRGEISAGYDGAGRRIRRKASGQTKAAVQNKLAKAKYDAWLPASARRMSGIAADHQRARRHRLTPLTPVADLLDNILAKKALSRVFVRPFRLVPACGR